MLIRVVNMSKIINTNFHARSFGEAVVTIIPDKEQSFLLEEAMFTRKFLFDLGERSIATAAQALLATLTVSSLPWSQKLQITAVAALAAILKGLVATQVGAENTAALLPRKEDTELGQSVIGLILGALGLLLILWGAYVLVTIGLSFGVIAAVVIGIVLVVFAWGGGRAGPWV